MFPYGISQPRLMPRLAVSAQVQLRAKTEDQLIGIERKMGKIALLLEGKGL
jgi:hypothetical protein